MRCINAVVRLVPVKHTSWWSHRKPILNILYISNKLEFISIQCCSQFVNLTGRQLLLGDVSHVAEWHIITLQRGWLLWIDWVAASNKQRHDELLNFLHSLLDLVHISFMTKTQTCHFLTRWLTCAFISYPNPECGPRRRSDMPKPSCHASCHKWG